MYTISTLTDANNFHKLSKPAANNVYQQYSKLGGSNGINTENPVSDTGWICSVITWSDQNNDDEAWLYYNGVATGPNNGLGVFPGGAMNPGYTNIGCELTTPLVRLWYRWLCRAAVFDYVLTQAQVTDLCSG